MTAGEASDEGTDRSPLERWFDVSVYAPLGFALEFRRLVPELAEAGRRQVEFSRSLGRAALRTMSRAASQTATTGVRHRSGPASPTEPEPDAEVAGYDAMNAKQVIAVARHASPAELRWIRAREAAAKRRKTVLAAIEQASDRHG